MKNAIPLGAIAVVAATGIAATTIWPLDDGFPPQRPEDVAALIADLPALEAKYESDTNKLIDVLETALEPRTAGFHLVRPVDLSSNADSYNALTAVGSTSSSPNTRFQFVPIPPLHEGYFAGFIPSLQIPTVLTCTRRLIRNSVVTVSRHSEAAGWVVTGFFDQAAVDVVQRVHGPAFATSEGPDWFGIGREVGERVTEMTAALAINDRVLAPVSFTGIAEAGTPTTVVLATGLTAQDSWAIVEAYNDGM